jgi:hypothetical protein
MIRAYIVWAITVDHRTGSYKSRFHLRPLLFTLDQGEAVNYGAGAGATTVQRVWIEKPEGWDDERDAVRD